MKTIIDIIRAAWSKKMMVFLIIFFLLLFLEGYLRAFWLNPRLEYMLDEDLVTSLRHNQTGFMWMGNMSYKSPPTRINADGHRGDDTDWRKPVIAAVGNSEAFGRGVQDSEVWTAVLEDELVGAFRTPGIQVVNAAHPGYGPYQHYVRTRRILSKHRLVALIVRVDIADRYFRPVTAKNRPRQMKTAKMRLELRRYLKSIPFLFNKFKAQVPSLRNVMRPHLFNGKALASEYTKIETAEQFWQTNKIWWEKIAILCDQRDIPVIFFFPDFYHTEGYRLLIDHFHTHFKAFQHIHFLHLTPESLGITTYDSETLNRLIDQKFTLRHDPHANKVQHRMIARTIFQFLKAVPLNQ